MVRDMAINTDGVSINLENGELTPSLDVADDLSIAFSSVDMGVLSDIRSLFKSIAPVPSIQVQVMFPLN